MHRPQRFEDRLLDAPIGKSITTMKTSTLVLASFLGFSGLVGCASDLQGPGTDTDAGMHQSPPACQSPRMTCGSVCADVQFDNANCGACGNRCNSGESCWFARCVPPNPPTDAGVPQDNGPVCIGTARVCDGACRDVQNNVLHCGACNHACGGGQTCVAGACTTPAPTCPGANLQGDVNNCGACGNRCDNGEACTNGMCIGGTEDTYEVTATAPMSVDSIAIDDFWNGGHCIANARDPERAGRAFTTLTCTFRVSRGAWVEFNATYTFPASSGLRATFACNIPRAGAGFAAYGTLMVRRNGYMTVMTQAAANGVEGCNYVAADRTRPAT